MSRTQSETSGQANADASPSRVRRQELLAMGGLFLTSTAVALSMFFLISTAPKPKSAAKPAPAADAAAAPPPGEEGGATMEAGSGGGMPMVAPVRGFVP